MTIQIEAVYENGVFRPMRPVPLAEHQRVTVTLDAEGPAEALPLHADRPPLRVDEGGVVRVGRSRISLDLIVEHYENGMTPEDMVRAYDTLLLADVHAVIAYYLRRRDEVRAYLKRRQEEAESLRVKIEAEPARLAGGVADTPQCRGEGQCCDWPVTPMSTARSSAACAAACHRSTRARGIGSR